MKKTTTTIRNKNLFCLNCGAEQIIPYPIVISMFGAMVKEFEKEHKNCPKIWKEPEADQSQSINEKALWWLQNGERGMSSEAMCFHLMGRTKERHNPCDPDDFRRCHLLLKAVPEWNHKHYRNKLKKLSPEWSKLVEKWDKLTEMLEELMKNHKPNGMYELMQECIKS
jgi:hypothetical protein